MSKIIFLGTGTSQGIPVIGCKCAVCQSQNRKDTRLRSSVHIEHQGKHFQIDIGPDFRQQAINNRIEDIDAVLFTHEHMDHVAGLDDLRPFIFKYRKSLDLYASERVQHKLKKQFDYAFVPPEKRYPGAPSFNLHLLEEEPITIENTPIIPLPVSHGGWPVLGFRIGDISYITDASVIPDVTFDKIYGSKILVLNALRVEKHYSHFNLEQAIEAGKRAQAEKVYFTHISHDLGLHEEVEKNLPPGFYLGYDGLVLEA